mmetsp:Transcript_121227/g.258764  ORF Transcript_121227/g.258764 Transcript_121227/m.258764 type:complete len:249 (+) Transcript_121227:110-856(+)
MAPPRAPWTAPRIRWAMARSGTAGFSGTLPHCLRTRYVARSRRSSPQLCPHPSLERMPGTSLRSWRALSRCPPPSALASEALLVTGRCRAPRTSSVRCRSACRSENLGAEPSMRAPWKSAVRQNGRVASTMPATSSSLTTASWPWRSSSVGESGLNSWTRRRCLSRRHSQHTERLGGRRGKFPGPRRWCAIPGTCPPKLGTTARRIWTRAMVGAAASPTTARPCARRPSRPARRRRTLAVVATTSRGI